MSKVKFNADEMMVMAMFEQPTRTETMRYIEEVVPFVEDDVEVFSLVASTIWNGTGSDLLLPGCRGFPANRRWKKYFRIAL